MKNYLFIILLALTCHSVFSQQKIELDNQFSGVTLVGNLRVKLLKSEDSLVRTYITLYGIDAQRFKWKQKGEHITMSLPSGLIEGDSYAEVEIYCNGLNRLISEGASVVCVDTLVGENLYVESLSSINTLNLAVSVKELELKAAASSNIKIVGSAQWATIRANMGARVDCGGAYFDDCTVKAGENSEVIVRVSTHLDATAGSKASVFYIGSPTTQIKSSLGGGVTPVILPSNPNN